MEQFINKIQMIIENNAELKNNKVLHAVLESVKFENNMQFLTDLKEGLSDVNKYLENGDLSSIINSVDDKIQDEKKNDINGYIKSCCNEFNIKDICDRVKEAVPAEPQLCSCMDQMKNDCECSQRPSYLYLNSLADILNNYSYYDAVKSALDEIQGYINGNKEKLCVLDTINYCDSMGNYGVNPDAVQTLKQCVVDDEYNPEVMAIKLGESINNGSIMQMLSTLRGIRSEKGAFELGQSDANTKVYNYVGPVLREGKDVTFYVDNTFIKVSPNKLDASSVSRVINEGAVNVYELNEMDVFNKQGAFYGAVKAFESLGFQLNNKGVSAKMFQTQVDFRLNENQTLDFYINNRKIENVNEAKKCDSLLVESQASKACLYTVLENASSIYNMPFVKFMINEQRGAASMIFNLGQDYFVYDFVSESKTDVFKLNAYKLYEFCLNKFGYDVSNAFDVKINDARAELKKIEEAKQGILKSIDEYKKSLSKIDETLCCDIQEEDRKSLNDLKDVLFGSINDLKSNYESLCKSSDKIRFGKGDSISEGCECSDGECDKNEADKESDKDETAAEVNENQTIKCPKCGKAHEKEEECECENVTENLDNVEADDIEDGAENLEATEDSPEDVQEITGESVEEQSDDEVYESFGATHYLKDGEFVLGIKFNSEGTEAKVLEGRTVSEWLPVELGLKNNGEQTLVIDSRGYNISIEDVKMVDEGFLDAAKAVGRGIKNTVNGVSNAVTYMQDLKALGVFGNIKVKNALRKYTEELPNLIAQRKKLEYDDKLNGNNNNAEEIKSLQEEEKLIKSDFDLSLNDVATKKPHAKSAVQRLKNKAQRQMIEATRKINKELLADEKYASLLQNDDKKYADLANQLTQTIDDEQKSNEQSGVSPQAGDKITLENGAEKNVTDVLIEYEEGNDTKTVSGDDVKSVKKV